MPCGGRELVADVLTLGKSIVCEMWSTEMIEVPGEWDTGWSPIVGSLVSI